MSAYITEWLTLLLRWAHVITGIAWIGSSFYFIWLDARLNVPPRDPEEASVAGDLWAVHGGGFYHAQKYKAAPPELPDPLHWFKWEAYFTWLTGFVLFVAIYYVNADIYLIDTRVSNIAPDAAVGTSIILLIAGWIVYSGLCALKFNNWLVTAVGVVVLTALTWLLSGVFSGRGMFLQIGVMLGTLMAANVFFVIIPAQKELVAAKIRGEAPDAALGLRAKQRSVHNNYFTLPVVFVMISPHYSMTYGHEYNWLVLMAIFVAGGLIRHFFNLRNDGRLVIAVPALALLILAALAVAIVPRVDRSIIGDVSFSDARNVIDTRCIACHSREPTHPTAPVPSGGVVFDTPEDIAVWAPRIYERAVIDKTMPLGNLTQMTDEERDVLAGWYTSGAPVTR